MRRLRPHARTLRYALLPLAALAFLAPTPARSGPDEPAIRQLLEHVERHGVMVAFRFQRDQESEERGAVAPSSRSTSERYRYWRMSWTVPGYVVRDRRTVLISDAWIAPGAIESVTVRTPDGTSTAASLASILVGVEGMLVKTEVDLPVEPLLFPKRIGHAPCLAGSLKPGKAGVEAWIDDLGGVRRRPVGERGHPGSGRPDNPFGDTGEGEDRLLSVDLVADREGRLLGFRLGTGLDADGRWHGDRVLASPELPLARIRDMAAQMTETSSVYRVKVQYRTTARRDSERDPFGFGGRETTEAEHWGVAIRPDLLLVPARLEDDDVRRILSIRLAESDDEPGPEGTYAGRLPGYDAFFVRVEGLRALPADVPVVPPIGSALLVHRVAWRGGARRDQIDPDRVAAWGRGYGDRSFLVTERAVDVGSFLLDAEGRMLGFAAVIRPEDRERRLGGRRGDRGPDYPTVAVLFQEAGPPASLADAPDTRIMPQEETESHRSPWLGVEYDSINEGVADLLEVSAPTRDGRRGLIVVRVYAGSPAAEAGIEDGDVLLSVQRRGEGVDDPPVDLRDRRSGSFFPGMFGFDSAPAPWRERDNALTSLLKEWGEGVPYELTWWHAGEERKAELQVAHAPPDFASAERHRDEATGLEVRDLTYEVRRALRMDADAPGVVVGHVEPGSPAAQARLQARELLLEADGRPIAGADGFESLLTTAREEGREQIRLVVRRLGKTRLVDLRIRLDEDEGEDEAPEEAAEDAGR